MEDSKNSYKNLALTCLSCAGFQSGSNIINLFAPIKFIPHPPALLERRKPK
jgi:hypothetical protein